MDEKRTRFLGLKRFELEEVEKFFREFCSSDGFGLGLFSVVTVVTVASLFRVLSIGAVGMPV